VGSVLSAHSTVGCWARGWSSLLFIFLVAATYAVVPTRSTISSQNATSTYVGDSLGLHRFGGYSWLSMKR
jgi:hypothetical protein